MSRIVEKVKHIVDKVDFWSIRDPFEKPGMDDLSGLGEEKKSLKGYELFVHLAHNDPIIYTAVQSVRWQLFKEQHNKYFDIQSSEPTISELIKGELLAKDFSRDAFGNDYELIDFLRDKASETMLYGRSYSRIKWHQTKDNGDRWTIESIRGLYPGHVREIKKDGTITQYEWRHRQNHRDQNSHQVTEIMNSEDIFHLEWVFGRKEEKGRSPIERCIKHHQNYKKFLTLSVAHAYALANAQDKRFWVERARYIDTKKSIEEDKQRMLLIEKELGISPQYPFPPMTSYYEVYSFVKFKKRLAEMRQYLIRQFNSQVVRSLAMKNGFSSEVKLITVGYQSSEEIEAIFRQFENREISEEQVVKMLD